MIVLYTSLITIGSRQTESPKGTGPNRFYRKLKSAIPFLQTKGELDAENTRYEMEDTALHRELDASHGRIELDHSTTPQDSGSASQRSLHEMERYAPRAELPGCELVLK